MTGKRDSHIVDVIGVISSCFGEKFGIPRQAGLAPSATATLELCEPYNRPELVRGLEGFSHLWLQFLFHEAVPEGWKPTVRPPRLGGKSRLGIFATRSPHRPNHLGLSVVRLVGIGSTGGRVCLELGGVDLLDGTPVVDIKPYLPYCDRIEVAVSGWPGGGEPVIEVRFAPEAEEFCVAYERTTGRRLAALIGEILRQDPRPASQRGRRKEFGMLLWDVNVRWLVDDTVSVVVACDPVTG